jgi:hypothetical protein
MQTQLKEGLSDIRERMMQNQKGSGWRKFVSFATAVGAVGAMALSRRFFDNDKPIKRAAAKTKSPKRKSKTKTKK